MNCGRRSIFPPRSPRGCALFGTERVHAIETYQLPFDVFRGPKIAVLIVPWSAMVDPLDLHIQDRKIDACIHPLPISSGWNRQFCLEGVAMIPSDNPVSACAMVFRTGVVEFVSPIYGPSADWNWIQSIVFETWEQFVAFAKGFGVEPPISIFVTMIEVAGLTLSTVPQSHAASSDPPEHRSVAGNVRRSRRFRETTRGSVQAGSCRRGQHVRA